MSIHVNTHTKVKSKGMTGDLRLALVAVPVLALAVPAQAQASAPAPEVLALFTASCGEIGDYDRLHAVNVAGGWAYRGTETSAHATSIGGIMAQSMPRMGPTLSPVAGALGAVLGATFASIVSEGEHHRVYARETAAGPAILKLAYRPGDGDRVPAQLSCAVMIEANDLPAHEAMLAWRPDKPDQVDNRRRRPGQPVIYPWASDVSVQSARFVPHIDILQHGPQTGTAIFARAAVTGIVPADGDPEAPQFESAPGSSHTTAGSDASSSAANDPAALRAD